ncbi:tctex1 domain-containing protein 3-like [Anneissia japonica]|uniref:tctex1 domain-containing protein 3-like n=1 Tax=Anneissia japonica TaxID=1529436 RepID=UPI0014259AD4|nr:tctex1 domain-containing protein 3-like [Anneissia japonica]
MTSTDNTEGSSCFALKTHRHIEDKGSLQLVSNSCLLVKSDDDEYTAKNAQPVIEPTYRMQPKKKLTRFLMEELINSVMEENFAEDECFLKHDYSAADAGKFCTSITTLIKKHLIDLGYERHKYVVQAMCVPCMGQGLDLASRMISDTRWDEYAVKEITPNSSMKVFIHVYSLYAE